MRGKKGGEAGKIRKKGGERKKKRGGGSDKQKKEEKRERKKIKLREQGRTERVSFLHPFVTVRQGKQNREEGEKKPELKLVEREG
jgi:hypothetical protein